MTKAEAMPSCRPLRGLFLATAVMLAAAPSAGVRASAEDGAFRPGDIVPGSGLVDERGAAFGFAHWGGRAIALSFIYTRCPDARFCPLVAGKFVYLQHRIDAAREHLVLATLDPAYDSPAILRAYARRLGADPARLTFVTGRAATLVRLARGFGIDPNRRAALIVHPEATGIVAPGGTVGDIVRGTAWEPAELLADLGAVAGIGYDPFELALVHLTWSIERACGLTPTPEPDALHSAVEASVVTVPVAMLAGIVLLSQRRVGNGRTARSTRKTA